MTNFTIRPWVLLIGLLAMLPMMTVFGSASSQTEAADNKTALIAISRGSALILTAEEERYDFSGAARMVCERIYDLNVFSVGYSCRRF